MFWKLWHHVKLFPVSCYRTKRSSVGTAVSTLVLKFWIILSIGICNVEFEFKLLSMLLVDGAVATVHPMISLQMLILL